MPEQEFLLSNTPAAEHRIVMEEDTAMLSTTVRFVLGTSDMHTLIWFLQAVKADKKIRHTFTDEDWTLTYDPDVHELEQFSMIRKTTGRTQAMALSTAYKLLNALTGKTERLVKE